MKFTVQYTFGIEWHTYMETSNAFEAKKAARVLRSRMVRWDGKLEPGEKIRIVKEG